MSEISIFLLGGARAGPALRAFAYLWKEASDMCVDGYREHGRGRERDGCSPRGLVCARREGDDAVGDGGEPAFPDEGEVSERAE